jgi:RNA polymerase sigma factor (sigma-70 family)
VTSADRLDDDALSEAVGRAKAGARAALADLLGAVQDDIYGLALRMTAHREDAEDATQEILVKVVTRLDSFRGDSSVRTWAYRIAVHHLLDRKKSRVEALTLDFERYGVDLLDGVSAEPDPDPVMARDVMLGCTLAMLTCLDREHRVAYLLGDVFDLAMDDAAGICEISAEAFRQRLSRARRTLEAFTVQYCGLVNPSAPCSCAKRVARAEHLGRVRRGAPELAEDLNLAAREMRALYTTAALFRAHPSYAAPERVREAIVALLDRSSLVGAVSTRHG